MRKEILEYMNYVLRSDGTIWHDQELKYFTQIGELGEMGVTSLDYWDLIMKLELKYNVSIPDKNEFKTIEDIIEHIANEKETTHQ